MEECHPKITNLLNSHLRDTIVRTTSTDFSEDPIEEKTNKKAHETLNNAEFFGLKKKGKSALINKLLGNKIQRKGNLKYREKLLSKFNFQKVNFETSDGITLKGTLVVPRETKQLSGQTYIFCSGSFGCYERYIRNYGGEDCLEFYGDELPTEEIYPRNGILHTLLNEGHKVFLFDYRGFGENYKADLPSCEGILIDADAAFHYVLKNVCEDPENIVLYGFSMGGAPAAKIGSEYGTDLILDRIFSDLGSVVEEVAAIPGLKKVAKSLCNKVIELSPLEYIKDFKGNNLKLILDDLNTAEKFKKILNRNRNKFNSSMDFNEKMPHIFFDNLQPSAGFLLNIRQTREHQGKITFIY